jgi:NADH-quinone oxidoreductase subunit M
MGLPGLNGFIGEFVIMAGAFQSGFLGWTFVAFAAIGVILAAVYLLRLFQGLASGTPKVREHGDHDHAHENADMTRRELGIMLPLCAVILLIGLYPTLLFRAMDPAVSNVLRFVGTAVAGG